MWRRLRRALAAVLLAAAPMPASAQRAASSDACIDDDLALGALGLPLGGTEGGAFAPGQLRPAWRRDRYAGRQ